MRLNQSQINLNARGLTLSSAVRCTTPSIPKNYITTILVGFVNCPAFACCFSGLNGAYSPLNGLLLPAPQMKPFLGDGHHIRERLGES